MNEPIENLYFNWLYSKVASTEVPTPSLTYLKLFRLLHTSEFVWLVSGDDNRAEDGLELRKQFLRESFIKHETPWIEIECSVLEMLIAFSKRAEFQTDLTAREWFWIFLVNLGLSELNDAASRIDQTVSDVLDVFVWRTYNFDGAGGMFPINNPRRDQRKLEIWYQFCDYLIDQELV
jgi:hypothetical protein